MAQAQHHLFLASALAVKAGHAVNPDFRIGMMAAYIPSYPMTCSPEDVLEAMRFRHNIMSYMDVQCRGSYPGFKKKEFARKGIVLETREKDNVILKEGTVDFIGFSYYMSGVSTVKKDAEKTAGNQTFTFKNPYLPVSGWGWAVDPTGLRISLNEIYDTYHLPLMIVENGLGAEDKIESDGTIRDTYRIEYLREHIKALKDAVEIDGVDVIGYMAWGCIDLVSAGTGEMKKRYGMAGSFYAGQCTYRRGKGTGT